MSELVMDGETVATIHLLRHDGLYGASVTVYANGFTPIAVQCQFSTFGALLSHIADLVSDAMKSRRGRQ